MFKIKFVGFPASITYPYYMYLITTFEILIIKYRPIYHIGIFLSPNSNISIDPKNPISVRPSCLLKETVCLPRQRTLLFVLFSVKMLVRVHKDWIWCKVHEDSLCVWNNTQSIDLCCPSFPSPGKCSHVTWACETDWLTWRTKWLSRNVLYSPNYWLITTNSATYPVLSICRKTGRSWWSPALHLKGTGRY